jgi:hypothetical protein
VSGRRLPIVDIEVVTRWTAVVRGRHVSKALERAGCPKQWQPYPPGGGAGAWTIPVTAVDDVAAATESFGGRATVVVTLAAAS